MPHRLQPDLVVLGSRGCGDLAGLLLGSVGHRVAASLDCPVQLVHGGDHAGRPAPIRRVLVAVDDSEAAIGAVFAAGVLAREHQAEVLVAHSLDDGAVARHRYLAARDAAYALLDDASRRLAAPGRNVESRLLAGSGSAAVRLAAEADRWDADLLVVGSRRLTDLDGLVLGSVAHELVRRSHRPVLLAERCRAEDPRRQGPSALGDRLTGLASGGGHRGVAAARGRLSGAAVGRGPAARQRGAGAAGLARRLLRCGPNAVRGHGARPWRVLLRQVENPLLVLLVAAALTSLLVGEHLDALIILAIIALSVGLGFVNEYRSERAVERLHQRIRHRAVAVRDGAMRQVDVTELVPPTRRARSPRAG